MSKFDDKKGDEAEIETSPSEESLSKLKLRDSSKYKEMVDHSLEVFGDEVDPKDVENSLGAKEVEPWSIRQVRVFGSSWFAILIFFLIANLVYSAYLEASRSQALSGVEAERERREVFAEVEDDFTPFRSFLALSPAVSDGDYSSFIRAVRDLNTYFPSQAFDNTALFSETGFSFHPGGLSYIDPE
jgi:hypothetical protein